MKIRITIVSLLCMGTLLFESCKKSDSVNNTSPTSPGYSKNVPEIGLVVNFNFQRETPDDFTVSLSDNFSLEQKNSVFNSDQKLEYFTLRCKKSDGTAYQINGTVDSNDAITISFQKAASITY